MSYPGAGKRKRKVKYGPYKRSRVSVSAGLGPSSLAEKKTIDTDPANYLITSTGSVTLLNGIATGTDFTDRIGRKIRMKSIYSRGVVYPEDNTTSNQLLRMLIVYDMQSNGAAPAVTDVLKSADPVAQLNLNNRDRFRVLVDKYWVIAPIDNTATQAFAGSPTIHYLKKYKKLNHETVFTGTTNAIGSISTGSIYMVLVGSNASGSAANLRVSHRIRFIDS